jgi:hypothetical protein
MTGPRRYFLEASDEETLRFAFTAAAAATTTRKEEEEEAVLQLLAAVHFDDGR